MPWLCSAWLSLLILALCSSRQAITPVACLQPTGASALQQPGGEVKGAVSSSNAPDSAGPGAGTRACGPVLSLLHTVFEADCRAASDLQSLGLVYSHRKAGLPGSITRLLRCSEAELRSYPNVGLVPTYVAPPPVAGSRGQSAGASGNGPPSALAHWLQQEHPGEGAVVLVLELGTLLRHGPALPPTALQQALLFEQVPWWQEASGPDGSSPLTQRAQQEGGAQPCLARIPLGSPLLVRYDQPTQLGEQTYSAEQHGNFDPTLCPPWAAQQGAEGQVAAHGLLPPPPHPSSLTDKAPHERRRLLLGVYAVVTLNAALCQRHLAGCPISEELVAQCGKVAGLEGEVEAALAALDLQLGAGSGGGGAALQRPMAGAAYLPEHLTQQEGHGPEALSRRVRSLLQEGEGDAGVTAVKGAGAAGSGRRRPMGVTINADTGQTATPAATPATQRPASHLALTEEEVLRYLTAILGSCGWILLVFAFLFGMLRMHRMHSASRAKAGQHRNRAALAGTSQLEPLAEVPGAPGALDPLLELSGDSALSGGLTSPRLRTPRAGSFPGVEIVGDG